MDPETGKDAVFLVTDYFPSTGGPTTVARALASELAARGWTVRVGTRRPSGRWPRDAVLDGTLIHRTGRPGYGKVAKVADLGGTWWWLAKMRRRPRVVLAFMDPDYAVAAFAAGLGSRTIVRWATMGDPARHLDGGPIRQAKVRLLRRARHVALTAGMARELEERGIGVDDVIAVPFDGARFAAPSPTQRAEARAELGIRASVTIMFSGHLEPRKGVDHLLEAFADLIGTGASAHLLVVGGNHGHAPDLGPALKALVQRRRLSSCVTFAGVVQDVVPYLQASDIFCLPSAREGMSNSLVEAMASGLACVAPASAGGEDLLAGGAGLIPESNSAADLLPALIRLANDPALRSRLGRTAIARIQANRLSQVADAYEDLFLGRQRPGSPN